jgi:competence ComEA-like helix-hairpin-helix protein
MSEQEREELNQEEGAADEVEVADIETEPADVYLEEPDAEPPKLDLNTATEEELRQLPGIGDALAARIVAYRTEVGAFSEPAEITEVTGVAEATYANLADRLTVAPVEPAAVFEPEIAPPETEVLEDVPVLEAEPQMVEDEEPVPASVFVSEPEVSEASPVEAPEPEFEPAPPVPPRRPEPPLVEVVEAHYGWARLILVGLASLLLGAALALAVIFLINGTLDFQGAAIRAAQDEVLRMEGVVGALDMKVAGLEERMGAIEELDARLTETQAALRRLSADLDEVKQQFDSLAETQNALRQEFTNMREDLDGLAVQTSTLDTRLSEAETQISYLNRRIDILGESVQRFDGFLTGLQLLLNQSLGDLPPTPTPWITPMDTPEAGVTVIPLATPTPTP